MTTTITNNNHVTFVTFVTFYTFYTKNNIKSSVKNISLQTFLASYREEQMVKMVFDKIIIIVLILKSYQQHFANEAGELYLVLVYNFPKNNFYVTLVDIRQSLFLNR